MENYQVGLLTTFLLGLFIIVGAVIAILFKKNNKIIEFSLGLALGVISTLLIVDIVPEIVESLGFSKIYLFIIFAIIGYVLLKVLDNFIPDHHEHKMDKHKSEENLEHIGIMTSLALVLHNIIEGMAVYSSCLGDPRIGFALTIGVGCHNIPLGMVIASSFYHSTKNKIKTILILLLVSLSTFLGGFIMFMFNLTSISEILLGILLSLTLGMLVYIVLDELIPRVYDLKKKKTATIGIITGIIVLVISLLF